MTALPELLNVDAIHRSIQRFSSTAHTLSVLKNNRTVKHLTASMIAWRQIIQSS